MNTLTIGMLLDRRYKIVKFISEGAFGQTFLAEDTKLPKNPLCVIKQFKPKHSHPEALAKAKELFNREAEALYSLGNHEQIPQLLAHLEIDRELYLVQEYILGQTLAEELQENPHKTEQEVIVILSELLEIVAFIHSHKIIHRDIKPSNIIRKQENNQLFLIDFGAAMEFEGETLLGTIIGTPGYIAFEQSLGRTGLYSDIYAVGVIGIQALTGMNPNLFNKDDNDEIIWQQKVSLDRDFQNILTKMVRRNKDDRYSTAEEVLQDIRNLSDRNKGHLTSVNREPIMLTETKISAKPLNKKLVLPSLFILTVVPLCWWITTSFDNSSQTTLPLNGKAIAAELNETNFCQDMILESDIYCQKYTFKGEKNREVVIEMNSNDFDPFLVLQKPNNDRLKINGDLSINNWNARIKAILPEDGTYTVITRTTSPGELGSYTVRARFNN